MNYRVVEKDNKRYIEFASDEVAISKEQHALDLISVCMENGIELIIIYEEVLSEDFFNLKTGLAGAILQKLMNYHVKAALVIKNEEKIAGRFREMVIEANKGNDFRVYQNLMEAESWLLK